MKAYYSDDSVTIYHGDCREMVSLPGDSIVSDPPYGINHKPSSRWDGERIVGDDIEFDPAPFIKRPSVLFGANHFARLLPVGGWIVWDKRDHVSRELPGSDAELAWTNQTAQVRIFRHVWIPHTLRREQIFHPTQKPLPLMVALVNEFSVGVVCDPFMGSGTTLRTAKNLGRQAIGIEIEERYCEIAARRMAQEVLAL